MQLDSTGTLPWKVAGESTLAAGPLQIYRMPGSVAFLHFGSLLLRSCREATAGAWMECRSLHCACCRRRTTASSCLERLPRIWKGWRNSRSRSRRCKFLSARRVLLRAGVRLICLSRMRDRSKLIGARALDLQRSGGWRRRIAGSRKITRLVLQRRRVRVGKRAGQHQTRMRTPRM